MPRRVDHQQRRRQIIDAVIRITVRGGLAAATFREVAVEAGVSVRLIQYYFGSKADLLLATQRQVAERSTARLLEEVGEAGTEPAAILRAVLTSFIPVDEESREAMTMFVALHTASLLDPTLARPEASDVPSSLRQLIQKQLEGARLKPGVDPAREAAVLTAMIPSLAQAVLDGSVSVRDATDTIDYAISRAVAARKGR